MLSALTVRKDQSFGFVTSESFRHPSSFCLIEESVVRHRVISCVSFCQFMFLYVGSHGSDLTRSGDCLQTTFLLFISMFVSFSLDCDSV